MSIIWLMPLFVVMCGTVGVLMGRELAKNRRRRMEEYRHSPESHILNLRD